MNTIVGLSIYDWYRVVLLTELILTFVLYGGALFRYIRRANMITDSSLLRGFRVGQAARIGGVMILLLLFILAVVDNFGTHDAGRLVYNLIVQIALALFLIAWWNIDVPRFRAVPASAVAHNILTALDDDSVSALDEHDTKGRGKQAN